jgi:hypothetical protein
MGKPTWAALADSLPGASTSEPVEYKPGRASKTCWYWANDGKCQNSAETCKYLHEHCAAGVAPRPNTWRRINWSRWGPSEKNGETEKGSEENENGNGGTYSWGEETAGEEEGELVLEEVQGSDSWGTGNGSAGWGNGWGNVESSGGGWGESSDDKYKAPHIRALEEKAQIEAIGW